MKVIETFGSRFGSPLCFSCRKAPFMKVIETITAKTVIRATLLQKGTVYEGD